MTILDRPPAIVSISHRLRLVRHRIGSRRWWALAAVAALVAGGAVARIAGDVADQAERWGRTRPVFVATHTLAAGTEITTGDVELVHRPEAVVPAHPAADPLGRRVAHPVYAGEVLVAGRLAEAGAGEVGARLPQGTVGLAVPDDGRGLRLEVGDRVDVLATFDGGGGGGDPTFPVARSALVVDVTEEGATVAVTTADTARVAYALAVGVVTLALVAP